MSVVIGIDVGTSGVRCAAVDGTGKALTTANVAVAPPEQVDGRPTQDPKLWWQAVKQSLVECVQALRAGGETATVEAIALDGTSGTMLACDANLNPLTLGLMYNSSNFIEQAKTIAKHAPAGSLVLGHSSGLARLLFIQQLAQTKSATHILHQADWLTACFCGEAGHSDANNALKTGYDPLNRQWPEFIFACGVNRELLPEVHEPGTQIGTLKARIAQTLGLTTDCRVHVGTTDSNAAFLASGASAIGDACTSIGTSMAVKLFADSPVTDLVSGVYSHRIGDAWLPGGASNVGGAVLLKYFTSEQIDELCAKMQPEVGTGIDYYPLPAVGERFPINDPKLVPRIEPRPDSDVQFCQALMEGAASVEKLAYDRLHELGAPKPKLIFSSGGGATNDTWRTIRSRILQLPVKVADSTDAAVGVARLARAPLKFG